MTIKTVAAVGASVAVFLAAAVPAFAHKNFMMWTWSQDELKVTNTNTKVDQDVFVKADSGDNFVTGSKQMPKPTFSMFGGWNQWGNKGNDSEIKTGDAWINGVAVGADVNSTAVEGCGCFDDITINNKFTRVYQDVVVKALTGDNRVRGNGEIRTGDAGVQNVVVSAFVNSTMVGGAAD